ncbi:class I SAM-dependent methyltransferase [Saccharothrix obliqua]|uniref:class I SAM-dependent methyltransferase n=1 Tax=Saccharothrix obliqua TaxID=2861747 RepID=UPI001C604AC8|nr:methyltransferase domain-containing protein [Saccharothrix obliqua]MBW4722487.1 class I SAM-dependent methyltransferase [Saccharothrix obliqua]
MTTAGTDHVRALLGDVRDRSVLDLGCGDPEVARRAAGRARDYVGLAGDEFLAAAARAAVPATAEVRVADLDHWWGAGLGRFDVVVSVTAPQHVRNLARLLGTLHHHVAPGGRFVFLVDHPCATAGVAGYFAEGERTGLPAWAGRPAHHRSLETYLRDLRHCGFRLDEFSEGKPGEVGFDPPPAEPPHAPRWALFRCVRTP